MALSKFLADLMVVIVLFKNKPEQSSAYISFQAALSSLPFLPTLFIYDNSPDEYLSRDHHYIYYHDPKNSGISRAYNKAVGLATKENKKWMLFLDQDTNVEGIIFEKLLNSINRHPGSCVFVPKIQDEKGLLSPFKYTFGRGKRIVADQEKYSLKDFRFVNSGMLINCDAFTMSGGYDEEIPLDFSDIAFGETLKKITGHFILIKATLSHSFSGNIRQQLPEALIRFHFFCRGAFTMGKKFGPLYLYYIRAFFRAARLSWVYKNPVFLKIFFQRALHG